MKLVIEMELGNDAIQENGTAEVRRIINAAIDRLPASSGYWKATCEPLFDYNGNNVGTLHVKGDPAAADGVENDRIRDR